MKYILLFLMLFWPGNVISQESSLFDGSDSLRSFEIICESDRHDITTHYKYSDSIYSFYTLTGGTEKITLLSVVPDRVVFSERANELNTGRKVEWSEIIIGIKDGAEYIKSSLGEPDLMTIKISTDNNPSGNIWSNININRIDAFLDSNGYARSVFDSSDEKDRCDLHSMNFEE